MSREDALKLLGGYATGTLTPAEHEALMAAALEDQVVFDAVMKEEALREAISEPGAKNALLAALEQAPRSRPWWQWRPAIGAVAMAGLALTSVAVWRAKQQTTVAPVIVAEVKPALREIAPVPVAPAEEKPVVHPRAVSPKPAAPKTASTEKAVPSEPAQLLEKDLADAKAKDASAGVGGAPPAQLAVPAAAPPPPPPSRAEQAAAQVGQLATPSPRVQQFQASPQNALVQANSPMLDRAKKAAPPVQWSLLRDDREIPPYTVLEKDEPVRFRIVPLLSGTVSLVEGEKVLATGAAIAGQTFETPPIAFSDSGRHNLSIRLAVPNSKASPLSLEFAITVK